MVHGADPRPVRRQPAGPAQEDGLGPPHRLQPAAAQPAHPGPGPAPAGRRPSRRGHRPGPGKLHRRQERAGARPRSTTAGSREILAPRQVPEARIDKFLFIKGAVRPGQVLPAEEVGAGTEKRPADPARPAEGDRRENEMKAKRAILFLAGLALLAAGATAGVDDDFAAANRSYKQGQYAAALSLYLKVNRRVSDWTGALRHRQLLLQDGALSVGQGVLPQGQEITAPGRRHRPQHRHDQPPFPRRRQPGPNPISWRAPSSCWRAS